MGLDGGGWEGSRQGLWRRRHKADLWGYPALGLPYMGVSVQSEWEGSLLPLNVSICKALTHTLALHSFLTFETVGGAVEQTWERRKHPKL